MKNEHWLRCLVEKMQARGAVNIRVVRQQRYVLLLGDMPGGGGIYNQLYLVKNQGTMEDQEQRIRRMLGQYRHWLEWVIIVQSREKQS